MQSAPSLNGKTPAFNSIPFPARDGIYVRILVTNSEKWLGFMRRISVVHICMHLATRLINAQSILSTVSILNHR